MDRDLLAHLDRLAMDSARVLGKYGTINADYTEWRDLKNSLLKVEPFLSASVAKSVGGTCSRFNEALRSGQEPE